MPNLKLGHYSVDNRIFYSKIEAILYANELSKKVNWHFNEDQFKIYDWTEEPTETLDFYYKQRAAQIREDYDYVIVMCSGGADSTNMIYSFLNNGLMVDEIVAGAPLSGLSNWKFTTEDTSANNTISETKYAQLPLMDKISKSHPSIKITIHDYFEDIVNIKEDEWIYETSSHWIHFSGTTRHSLDKFSHIKDLAENGKRIAVVYGIDKPIIQRTTDGDLYTVVMDSVVNIVTSHFKEKYENVESVLFYYTPELPFLMIKQAHEVCRWLYRPENHMIKQLLWDESKPKTFNADPIRGSKWQRGIVPCIYPSLNNESRIWQADKHTLGFLGGSEIDHWMYVLHRDLRVFDMVHSNIRSFVKNIARNFFIDGDKRNGFVRFYNSWKIGNETDFINLKGNK
jgi:hypothetical protein